jgi:hypothetical protein
MILLKVEYEFFDYEEPSSMAHELDRQIRLQFADSPTLYVSWTSERYHGPDSEPYSIAYAESSYFSDSAARVIDVSDSPLWSRHIRQLGELVYTHSSSREAEYQVLEMRSDTDCTYIYSLGLDRVGISGASPLSTCRSAQAICPSEALRRRRS